MWPLFPVNKGIAFTPQIRAANSVQAPLFGSQKKLSELSDLLGMQPPDKLTFVSSYANSDQIQFDWNEPILESPLDGNEPAVDITWFDLMYFIHQECVENDISEFDSERLGFLMNPDFDHDDEFEDSMYFCLEKLSEMGMLVRAGDPDDDDEDVDYRITDKGRVLMGTSDPKALQKSHYKYRVFSDLMNEIEIRRDIQEGLFDKPVFTVERASDPENPFVLTHIDLLRALKDLAEQSKVVNQKDKPVTSEADSEGTSEADESEGIDIDKDDFDDEDVEIEDSSVEGLSDEASSDYESDDDSVSLVDLGSYFLNNPNLMSCIYEAVGNLSAYLLLDEPGNAIHFNDLFEEAIDLYDELRPSDSKRRLGANEPDGDNDDKEYEFIEQHQLPS